MKFVDEAVIKVIAGKGGDGCISFRRERFIPKGGPDGGDGGDGGSCYLIGNAQIHSLADLTYPRTFKAGKGEHGKGKNCHGKKGKDLYIPVPLGSDVYDFLTNEYLGSILKDKETLLVAKGGKGGRGNTHFKSPTNQAPRIREKGEKGEEREIKIILRLLADIGIVGLPNAGKSTLLSRLTKARPKIAPYPFTTLTPNLGVLRGDDIIITVADMPGIIKDAHKGKGLGLRFLRHIERTRLLLYLVDITALDPIRDFEVLREEIASFNEEILRKKQVLAFNKIDLLPPQSVPSFSLPLPTFFISALKGDGINELASYLMDLLKSSG
jgi:GTP-binding protein|uniref:GTPase Obg n=1 Tax=candidate division WOR-3 bacterium TaxID=2052148 RepID=A0A7C3UQ18_UNCW3